MHSFLPDPTRWRHRGGGPRDIRPGKDRRMNAVDILTMVEDAPLGSWVADARAEFLTGLLEEIGEHGEQIALTTSDEDRPSDLPSLATALERLALISRGDEVA